MDVAEEDESTDVRAGAGVDEGIDIPAGEVEAGRGADEDVGTAAGGGNGGLFCRCGRSSVSHTRVDVGG